MPSRYFSLLIALTICLIFFSCIQDVNLTCRSGSFNTSLVEDSFADKDFEEFKSEPHPDKVHYQYIGERVSFLYGFTVENICPGEVVEAIYEITTSAQAQSPDSRIYSVANWAFSSQGQSTGTTQSSVFAYDLTPHTVYSDTMTISDIHEVFGEFEAHVEFYLRVEFDRYPSFEEDSTYFVNHFSSLKISVTADRFL